MHAVTGPRAPRPPADRPALDGTALGDLRQETRRDVRLVIAVLLVAIATSVVGLVHSLS